MYFSIIIPCYNAEKTISRTLNSLLAQKDFLKEIILIDDGSTDQTAAIVKQYQNDYSSELIHYYFQVNQGPARARNEGAHRARGAYAIFLDNDDSLRKDALATFHTSFENEPQVDILIAGYCDIDDDRHRMRYIKPYQNNTEILKGIWRGELSASGGCKPMRTHVLKNFRYPEHIRHGDDVIFFSHIIAKHAARILPFIALDFYHTHSSLRHSQESILKDNVAWVNQLFDSRYLTPEQMTYHAEFRAKILLRLVKAATILGRKEESMAYLRQAFQAYPKSFLKAKTLKICLRASRLYWS